MSIPLRLVAGLFCASLASACSLAQQSSPADTSTQCTVLIENVNVRPMDTPRLMSAQDVRLDGSQITSITQTGTSSLSCEQTIDGSELFLMPGLNDMHTHLESEAMAEAMQSDYGALPFDALVSAYVRYGITGLRLLSGSPDILTWRSANDAAQPLVILSGSMLSGHQPVLPEPMTRIVTSAEEARDAVRSQAAAGYDLVKIRANVSPDVHAAIIDEANLHGLHVEGHLPYALSIDEVLRSGQRGIAHLFELAWAIESGHAEEDAVIEALTECGCYVSTTIGVTHNIHHQQQDFDQMFNRPEMAFMHPMMVETFWSRELNPNLNNPHIPRDGFFLNLLTVSQDFAVRLNAANIPLLVGSDALNPMLVHGTSFHDELDLLIAGGLPTYAALRSATATPAEHVPGFEDVGIVAPGRRANLLLTAADPLDDHSVLRDPVWVILNGVPLSRSARETSYRQSTQAWQ